MRTIPPAVRFCSLCLVRVANPCLYSDADASLRFCSHTCQRDAHAVRERRGSAPEIVVVASRG